MTALSIDEHSLRLFFHPFSISYICMVGLASRLFGFVAVSGVPRSAAQYAIVMLRQKEFN